MAYTEVKVGQVWREAGLQTTRLRKEFKVMGIEAGKVRVMHSSGQETYIRQDRFVSKQYKLVQDSNPCPAACGCGQQNA